MQFTSYALPAMLALLAKIGMFFYARYSKVHNLQTRLYLWFLFSLSIQNLTEITFFASKAAGITNPPGGKLYFSTTILALAFFLHLALILGTRWRGTKDNNLPLPGIILIYAPALILGALLLSTPLIVVGLQPMGYTYTKIPGSLYFLFELYAIGYMCMTVVLLAYGALTQLTAFCRLQNKLLLFGFIPFIVLGTTIIVLQRLGFRGFNTTATLPIAGMLFLAITAYAIHQYRLFDVAFFIPWSKARKRKTVFYQRIQALIAEIADMTSVDGIVQSLSKVLHCPVVLISGSKPAIAMAGEALGVARFPLDELKKIDRITLSHEIADTMGPLHTLMRRHKVAAIVPFHPYSDTIASWMLLGESFSEQVYTSRDFEEVETLFARLADRFLDKQLLLRSQLSEAQRENHSLHERLAKAWDQLENTRKKLKTAEDANHRLAKENREYRERLAVAWEEVAVLQRNAEMFESEIQKLQHDNVQLRRQQFRVVKSRVPPEIVADGKTFYDYIAQTEEEILREALRVNDGDVVAAARLLRITDLRMFNDLIAHHGIDPGEYR